MKVKILWTSDWWDGPLKGMCEVDGEILWFNCTKEGERIKTSDNDEEDDEWSPREFDLYRLTKSQMEFKMYWHGEFRKHVKDENGNKPGPPWPLFYSRYDKVKDSFDLKQAQLIGHFNDTEITEIIER